MYMPHCGTQNAEKRKMFAFPSLDAAVDAVCALCAVGCGSQAVLYECEGRWYLSSPKECGLSEFGRELGGVLWEPYVAEHGEAVAKGEALIQLAEAFGK